MLLNHIRWIEFVVDINALGEKIVQCLYASPTNVQQDIIAILPEVFGGQKVDVRA